MTASRLLFGGSMARFHVPTCKCGHTSGDHASAGTSWPHPSKRGACHVEGCDCREFDEAKAQAA